jgi:hypothetical protein
MIGSGCCTIFEEEIAYLNNVAEVRFSSGQRNMLKTYHNEANTGGISKIASIFFRLLQAKMRKITKFLKKVRTNLLFI